MPTRLALRRGGSLMMGELNSPARRKALSASRMFAPTFHVQPEVMRRMDVLRRAINDRHPIRFSYSRADATESQREVRPLGLFFWGKVWTLAGWCQLRDDFRNFRVDRIGTLEVCRGTWTDEAGKALADFLRRCEDETFSER